jgi:CBS domain containing-hemolysin-like protein
MQTLAGIGFMIIGAILTMVASFEPRRTHLSMYELERRKKEGNTPAADELRRRILLDDILSLRHVLEVLLLVLLTVTGVAAFGPLFGVLASVMTALYYGRIAQTDMVHSLAQKVYDPYEETLLKFIENNPVICRMLRSMPPSDREDTKLHSREELEYLVQQSHGVLREEEKKMIINGLHFDQKTVEQIMTPRGVIESIDKDAVLGPLVLNDLHKTGHTRFPIIDGDIDHVVGILHIRGLLALNDKQTRTAGELMDKRVYYINQDQGLHHALAAFLRTHHHLFIVVNEYRETAGVISIEDVMESLLGRRIMDEYDSHDDLRVVAKRNAKHNNNPAGRVDV